MTLRARVATFLLAFISLAPIIARAELIPPVPQTPAQVAANCEKAKQKAASHAESGFDEVSTDDGGVYKDNCVAAILNKALRSPDPASTSSYLCVGKRTKISITLDGRITDTNVPDPSVPAGKCETTACTDYSGTNASCFPANKQTSLFEEAFKFLNSFLPSGTSQPSIPFQIGIRG